MARYADWRYSPEDRPTDGMGLPNDNEKELDLGLQIVPDTCPDCNNSGMTKVPINGVIVEVPCPKCHRDRGRHKH